MNRKKMRMRSDQINPRGVIRYSESYPDGAQRVRRIQRGMGVKGDGNRADWLMGLRRIKV